MKVPPTRSADARTPATPGTKIGAATPAAIASAATVHTRRVPATKRVESAAVAPNSGQAQPNTAGSSMMFFAIAGTKVAGMM